MRGYTTFELRRSFASLNEFLRVSACVFAIFALAACARLPETLPRGAPGAALAPQAGGIFAELESAGAARHGPNESAFTLLDKNEDGLRWRLALIDSAQHSLDLQYYVWWGDESGDLLMHHLLQAADRGVKVRLILDDLSTILEDESHPKLRDLSMEAIDAHANIEVRLFNAWRSRELGGRALEMIERMERINHRMHNKLMVADNRAVILGGRNVGNEYFGLSPIFNFCDLDLLGIGPVARQGSSVFDRFWNSDWVVPASAVGSSGTPTSLARESAALREKIVTAPALVRFPIDRKDWRAELDELAATMVAGTSEVHTDHPDADVLEHHMPTAIRDLLGTANREVLITNAYIIPGEHAVARMREQIEDGISIRMLTNSLASHDVPAVNSHYKRWRGKLVDTGIDLFELRSDAAVQSLVADTPPNRAEFMGLHVKAIVIDRTRVFVGSMNLDPRSWGINSEMGVVVESPALADALANAMERLMLPENAWHVTRDGTGQLHWVTDASDRTSQPARSLVQRVQDVIFTAFPQDLY